MAQTRRQTGATGIPTSTASTRGIGNRRVVIGTRLRQTSSTDGHFGYNSTSIFMMRTLRGHDDVGAVGTARTEYQPLGLKVI